MLFASALFTVAVTETDLFALSTLIPDTVTAHVAFLLPPFSVAVIVALPAFFAVTIPLLVTVATEVLEDFQVTPWL